MNETKLQKISKIISEKKDDDSIRNYIIQILQNLLDFDNYKEKNKLWFEEESFQEDKEYVNLINSYIDIFIKYLYEATDFNETEFHKEITNAVKNNKYSNLYKIIRTIFLKLDKNDEIFYEIYWCVYFLGFKKNSPLNETFVCNLKEITQYPQIKNCFYREQISQLNFKKIDENFLNYLNKLIDLIILNKNKNPQIDEIIVTLKLIENLTEENKSDFEKKKIENVIVSYSNIQNIIQNQIEDKSMSLDKNQNEEKKINEIESEYENNNSTKTSEFLNNSFEKFSNFVSTENDFSNEEQNNIFNIMLQIIQRFNAIIHMKSIIKKKIAEYENAMELEKKFMEKNFQINENFIKINRLKVPVKLLTPSNVINLKRKVIDISVFLIIKNNKDDFELNEKYSPNSKFLRMALNKLNEIKDKNIDNKKKLINDLLKADSTITSYPLIIKNPNLKSLISFLNFYKSKFSNIAHIGHESIKYYLLPIKTKEFPYLPCISTENKDINKIKEEQKLNTGIKNTIYGEKIEFDFDIVLELLLKDNFNIDNNDLEKKMDIIKEEKEKIFKFSEKLSKFVSKEVYNNDEEINFEKRDKIFTSEDISFSNSILGEFQEQINILKNEIENLLKNDNDFIILNNNIENFQNKFNKLLKKELSFNFDEDYKFYSNIKKNLLYYKYKYDKLNSLYKFIKYILQIFNQNFQSKMVQIMEKINTIKTETENMNEVISKITYLNSFREVFYEWKFKKQIYKNNFDSFIDILKNSIKKKKIKVRIDNDFIYDQLISSWMIKNDLDDLLVN